jgi:hypothetical protein
MPPPPSLPFVMVGTLPFSILNYVLLCCVLFCFCFELRQLANNTKLFHAAKQKKQHARLLLSYQIGGATMGVDHVGTMQQWEERMATSM